MNCLIGCRPFHLLVSLVQWSVPIVMGGCWLLTFDRLLLSAGNVFVIPVDGLLGWMLVASF
jgi:hypothetical protein